MGGDPWEPKGSHGRGPLGAQEVTIYGSVTIQRSVKMLKMRLLIFSETRFRETSRKSIVTVCPTFWAYQNSYFSIYMENNDVVCVFCFLHHARGPSGAQGIPSMGGEPLGAQGIPWEGNPWEPKGSHGRGPLGAQAIPWEGNPRKPN